VRREGLCYVCAVARFGFNDLRLEGLLSSWSSVMLCAPMSTPLLWLSVFSTIAEAVNM